MPIQCAKKFPFYRSVCLWELSASWRFYKKLYGEVIGANKGFTDVPLKRVIYRCFYASRKLTGKDLYAQFLSNNKTIMRRNSTSTSDRVSARVRERN